MPRARFARTPGDEAFPFGAKYGCTVTRYKRGDHACDWALYVVSAIGGVVIWWFA